MAIKWLDPYWVGDIKNEISRGARAGLAEELTFFGEEAVKYAKKSLIEQRTEYNYVVPEEVLNAIRREPLNKITSYENEKGKTYCGTLKIVCDSKIAKYIEYGTGLVGAGVMTTRGGTTDISGSYPGGESLDGQHLEYTTKLKWRYRDKRKNKGGLTSGQIGSAFMYKAREYALKELERNVPEAVKCEIDKKLKDLKG